MVKIDKTPYVHENTQLLGTKGVSENEVTL